MEYFDNIILVFLSIVSYFYLQFNLFHFLYCVYRFFFSFTSTLSAFFLCSLFSYSTFYSRLKLRINVWNYVYKHNYLPKIKVFLCKKQVKHFLVNLTNSLYSQFFLMFWLNFNIPLFTEFFV